MRMKTMESNETIVLLKRKKMWLILNFSWNCEWTIDITKVKYKGEAITQIIPFAKPTLKREFYLLINGNKFIT